MSLTKMEPEPSPELERPVKFDLEIVYEELTYQEDPERINELIQSIFSYMKSAQGKEFQASLQLSMKIVSKGYANMLAQSPEIYEKIIRYFVEISRQLKKYQSFQLSYRRLFLISILAQFLRQQSSFKLPYNKQFLLYFLQIQAEDVQKEFRNKLLAILGVIYSNISKQPLKIYQLKIGKIFKEAILSNYQFIEESFTFKIFNQCILTLQSKKVIFFTHFELERYGIKTALLKLFSNQPSQIVNAYIEKLFPVKPKKAHNV